MVMLVGLGNPGQEYEGTRHNIGFEIVDRISRETHISFKPGRGDYLIGFGSFEDCKIGLVKPLTFMNNSGDAVLDIRSRYDVPLERFLIICDDFQLPLGQLRIRPGGSDGGHNGLYSIIYHLKSDSFPRLRCGIGSQHAPGEKTLMARFVLEQFAPDEHPVVRSMVVEAASAALHVVAKGIQSAMNAFHKKVTL